MAKLARSMVAAATATILLIGPAAAANADADASAAAAGELVTTDYATWAAAMKKAGHTTPAESPSPASPDEYTAAAAVEEEPDLAPDPGGGDGTWSVIKATTDRAKKAMPLRTGTKTWGMRKIRAKHGITSSSLVHAIIRADVNIDYSRGRTEPTYNGMTYYTNRPERAEEIIVGGSYNRGSGQPSSVKGNIGVLTAYCKGKTVCPTWVNGYGS